MELLNICVGIPKIYEWQGQEVSSAILKREVLGPVQVLTSNIEGDLQADLAVHGGHDKAIYGFSHDCYAQWSQLVGRKNLEPGAVGENLLFSSLNEKEIFVGDVFELGTCQLQAVQAREPCFKLGILYNNMKVVKQFFDMGRPGVYFRVLKEGQIQTGDKLKLIRPTQHLVSIFELFEFRRDKKSITPQRAAEISRSPDLLEKWQRRFLTRSLDT